MSADSADGGAPAAAKPAIPLAYATPTPPRPDDPELRNLAIGSFVCALVVCIPVLTGLFAVLAGLSVLARGHDIRQRDRVMACLGTSIGAVQAAVWVMALTFG